MLTVVSEQSHIRALITPVFVTAGMVPWGEITRDGLVGSTITGETCLNECDIELNFSKD